MNFDWVVHEPCICWHHCVAVTFQELSHYVDCSIDISIQKMVFALEKSSMNTLSNVFVETV